MLDKQLCALFGIDQFNQWVMAQLDYVEDQLYASEISSPRYIELKARHQALKDARDVYWAINQKDSQKRINITGNKELNTSDSKAITEAEPATCLFEIILFDQQDDPSRFYKLTHHFDYICPLDEFPDVSIWGVDVNICVCKNGYRVIVTGQISGEHCGEALAAVDTTDWGRVSLVAITMNKVKKNK